MPVDLRELAIDRSDAGSTGVRRRRHLLTRYFLPLGLIFGFLSLLVWASWDLLLPPRDVTVMPVIATTAEVQEEGTPLFQAAGWIEPRPTPIRVAALAPGVVEKLNVVEDDLVKQGDPIAELIKDDAQFSHQRALADLNLRKAELEATQANYTAAKTRFTQPVHLEAALREAEALLAKIETQVDNLPFELQRAVAEEESARIDYEGKADSVGVVAGNLIDIAKSKWESSKALVQELKGRKASYEKEQQALSSRRDALKTQLELLADETNARDTALADVKAAEARVQQAEVVVAEAKLRLERMTITAPVDGRIFRLIAHPGARIGSGMTQMEGHDGSTIVTMYRPSMLQIRVDVRFEDIPKVSLNQPVEIDNPALSAPLIGNVLFISSEADIQKNTLQVKVAIPDPPAVFKPEMLVDVTFQAPPNPVDIKKDDAGVKLQQKLYVPERLVIQNDVGACIWTADQSAGVAVQTKVETGATSGNGLIEIKKGLSVTSRLIVSGADDLRAGQRIHITGEEAVDGAH